MYMYIYVHLKEENNCCTKINTQRDESTNKDKRASEATQDACTYICIIYIYYIHIYIYNKYMKNNFKQKLKMKLS